LVEHSLGKGEVISSILIIGSMSKVSADMHNSWLILRLACSAAIVVYLVLCLFAGRMSRWEKKFNDWLFVAVVVFVGARIFARYIFHDGLIFQLALVLAGSAAAIGIPLRMKALIARIATNSKDGATDVKLRADS
jgi:signal transduction histidine kinase